MENLLKNKQRALCDKVESRGIVYQLLARFLKRAQIKVETKDDRIEKAILYIRKHIYEAIDLATLSENSCLSKDHFIRLFEKRNWCDPFKIYQSEENRKGTTHFGN